MSTTVIPPVRVPVTVGVKVTEIWQLACAARLDPQVVDSAKSPEIPMLLMDSGPVPVLVKVTDCAVLVLPST